MKTNNEAEEAMVSFNDVDLFYSSDKNIKFSFKRGELVLKFTNFSGEIILKKSEVESKDTVINTNKEKSDVLIERKAEAENIEMKSKKKEKSVQKKKNGSSPTSSTPQVSIDQENMPAPPSQTPISKQLKKATSNNKRVNNKANAGGSGSSVSRKRSLKEDNNITPSKVLKIDDKLKEELTSGSPSLQTSFEKEFDSETKLGMSSGKKSVSFAMDALVPAPPKMLINKSPPKKSQETSTNDWETVNFEGKSPVGRWGFSLCDIGGNKAIIYGGEDNNDNTLGDVHIYDSISKKWESPVNVDSAVRSWHTATYVEAKEMMIVFGGERKIFGDTPEIIGEVMVLDCSDKEMLMWYPPELNGKGPSPRSGHSASLVGEDIIFFGGCRGRIFLNDVFVLNTVTWKWTRPEISGQAPEARCYHSAIVQDKSVIIVGGNTATKCLNQIHILDTSEDTWNWITTKGSGDLIPPMTGCASVRVGDFHVLYHGGWDTLANEKETTIRYDDIHILDTRNMKFKKISTKKLNLSRVGHCLLNNGEGDVLSLFGQDNFDNRSDRDIFKIKMEHKMLK